MLGSQSGTEELRRSRPGESEGKYDRLPALAAELMERHVAVIVANTPGAFAAKAVITTVPIVFSSELDPVKVGLVANLNRPGGNITGVSSMSGELVSKQLELLYEFVRKTNIIAALVNPTRAQSRPICRWSSRPNSSLSSTSRPPSR